MDGAFSLLSLATSCNIVVGRALISSQVAVGRNCTQINNCAYSAYCERVSTVVVDPIEYIGSESWGRRPCLADLAGLECVA